MKKFLSLVLFFALACCMMLVIDEDFRLFVEKSLPSISISGSLTGPQANGTTVGNNTSGSTTGSGTQNQPNSSTPTPPTPIITDGGYYFEQLSDISKTVYSAIYSDPLNTEGISIRLPEAVAVTVEDGEDEDAAKERLQASLLSEIQPALDALAYDHPEIDWIRMGDGGGSTFQFTPKSDENRIYIDELHFILVTEEREGGAEAHRDALKAAIGAIEITGESRYEILLSIQTAICELTVYELNGIYAHDAAGVFLKGEAVCDGYAKAFKLLCDRYGIPCIIVAGTAVQSGGSEAHAWNYVQMEDGLWYAVDVTWNDNESGTPDADYFLVGSETKKSPFSSAFSESHLPKGHFSGGNYEEFALPTLATERYTASEEGAEEDGELAA